MMDGSHKLVWFPDDKFGFSIGKICDIKQQVASVELVANPSKTSVRYELANAKASNSSTSSVINNYLNNNNNNVVNSKTSDWPYESIFPLDRPTLEELKGEKFNYESLIDYDDNCSLVHLNEPSLLDNIRVRYHRNKIYTYVANILIAVNPYVEIKDLHSEKTISEYQGKSLGTMPPHVYAIADKAYRDMKALKQSQSIIISGESGAGKTESQKYVLKYLCIRASQSKKLEQLILDANPLLEAFGNAKTIRNNNSSRFGKFIKLQYSRSKLQVCGAQFMHYLLEKSRICSQSSGERNYHIFYQLCAALPDDEWRQLGLSAPDKFRYLQTGCSRYFGKPRDSSSGVDRLSDSQRKLGPLNDPLIDDVKCFERTNAALSSFGVSDKLRSQIYRVAAAILHLGNIEFVEAQDGSLGCQLAGGENGSSRASLELSAKLLGLDTDLLRESLTSRVMSTSRGGHKGTIYMVQLSVSQASSARDALAKSIYARLFDFVVTRVVNAAIKVAVSKSVNNDDDNFLNSSSTSGKSCNDDSGDELFIGVLDVAGFEYFERNSFEQLLINFCNEKLQQFFNCRVLNQEQATYESEGLAVTKVSYADNSECLELFEAKKYGLFTLLDDECRLPKPSAAAFTRNAHARHGRPAGSIGLSGNNSTVDKVSEAKLALPRESKVRANRELRDDEGILVRHFAGSVCYETGAFIEKNNDALHSSLSALMFESNLDLLKSLFSTNDNKSFETSLPMSSTDHISSQNQSTNISANKLNFVSVSATFRAQLNELMAQLAATGSHFVKCVKPNSGMVAHQFDGAQISAQLHCSGMQSVLELMQVGFPSRAPFAQLHAAYKPWLPASLARLEARLCCRALLRALGLSDKHFQFGATKLFFKAGKFAEFDALMRTDSREHIAALVARAAAWLLAARWRQAQFAVMAAVKLCKCLESRRRAVVHLQRCWRQAIVARQVGGKLKLLRDARRTLNSLTEFGKLVSENSAYKSMPERNLLEQETKVLRDQLNQFSESLSADAKAAALATTKDKLSPRESNAAWQAQLDKLTTKRDLLVRTINDKMGAQLANLERQLADEREQRARQEFERVEAAKVRDERQKLEQRRQLELSAAKAAESESNKHQKTGAIQQQQQQQQHQNSWLTESDIVMNKQAIKANHVQGLDLSRWKYSELRDTINTSCDLALLEACKREFHRRLKVYHAWKAANTRSATDERAPSAVLGAAAAAAAASSDAILVGECFATSQGGNEQRYFRIPFARTIGEGAVSANESRGWWFAHFDGQWIARQLELHPGRRPVLLIAGRDDMSMCELSLRETCLTERRGAEITKREFEFEWNKSGGQPYSSSSRSSSTNCTAAARTTLAI